VSNTDLIIKSVNGDYEVKFLSIADIVSNISSQDEHYLVVDKNVYPILKQYNDLNNGRIFLIDALEENKNLSKVWEICAWLASENATKKAVLVGIGGGIVQDLTTFSAHIYFRGIDWVNIPTTLLSQADSCIGSKCALNLSGHKNQIGVIHTPRQILISTDFLSTLPRSEIESGFGEIAKLSVTGPNSFFEEFSKYLQENQKNLSEIGHLIRLSLLAKRAIIEEDEYESNLRRILNYGHTFGHAIESLTQTRVVHGDAVVMGMQIINQLGSIWGITSNQFMNNFDRHLYKYFSGLRLPDISSKQFMSEISRDKKVQSKVIHLAIPANIGVIEIVPRKIDANLEADIQKAIDNVRLLYSA
jgi:3-dehydroquinate synthase